MVSLVQDLPSDVGLLREMIFSLSRENQLLADKNQSLAEENQTLKEQLVLLRAKRFGKKSEKLDRQIEEIELKIEENEAILGIKLNNSNMDLDDVKNHPKRQKIPEHLPREDIVLKPEETCPSCGGKEFRKISDDISERLEYVPSSFKVIRYVRPRCACINCEQIVQAYAPTEGIDKGKAGTGLLSHILVQKYCNHLPLYRQSQIYAREGIEISRTTMAGWAGSCARLLQPIVDEIRRYIFSASQIHGDDTPVNVLAPGFGQTKTGRIWAYVLDGRPHGQQTPPAVCYFYSPDRKGERPKEHLKDFTGILHADAYAGYDQLYNSDKNPAASIEEAACWAHMRRKFYDIMIVNGNANVASAAVEQIAEIYKIEAEIKGLSPEQRLQQRTLKSKPLVENLFAGCKKAYELLPKKGSTAKAIAYAMNHQKALMRFLDNGKIEIDNNAAERAIRAIALGRKNWLFAGSDKGGDTAASIYSIIETAKLNDINPWLYIKKVLDSIQDYKSSKISELLPWNIIL